MQPQTMNDRDGQYLGADMRVHATHAGQEAVYGTFSGWDEYRAQIQLLGLLRPDVAGDMATSHDGLRGPEQRDLGSVAASGRAGRT